MQSDMPDMEEQIRKGEFGDLLAWLVTNIHQHGKKYEPQELVQRVTGSKIDSAPYVLPENQIRSNLRIVVAKEAVTGKVAVSFFGEGNINSFVGDCRS